MLLLCSCCRCDLKVVSDANTFFIETVLAHHGVLGCFSEIVTNPASVDADGRLRISTFHDSTAAPHGCSLCPDNMCKVLRFTNSRTADRFRYSMSASLLQRSPHVATADKTNSQIYLYQKKRNSIILLQDV